LVLLAALVGAVCTSSPCEAGSPKGWGGDINAGDGPQLIEAARGDLAAIVAADPKERAALAKRFADEHGLLWIEAAKRFRNPELVPLFRALLEHSDWHVQHRALYALEYYGDSAALPEAWKRLTHAEPRLREKAAIACIKLWDKRAAGKAAGGDPVAALRDLLAREPSLHVRRCLAALLERAAGKLTMQRVYTEFLRKDDDGLLLTPFLSGMNNSRKEAPGYSKKGVSQGGGGNASKAGPSSRWTTPLLGQGQEEVQGTSLQPFANLRGNGTVYHTGLDVGACMDGAGYYAAADGVVRLVHSGSDMGTLIVVQHCPEGKETVNAVYMHGGDTVFVKGGQKVRCGQLLGTMGMSYSLENGGHYAHLHYGLYPGNYSDTHNYGYKSVKAGLADWLDPAVFLPEWIERTAPLLPELRAVDGAFGKALELLRDDEIGRASAAVDEVLAGAGLTDAQRADGEYLREQIALAVRRLVERAEKQLAAGYPAHAQRMLAAGAKRCAGLAGVEEAAGKLAGWRKDAAFKKALKGEAKIASTAAKAAKLAGKKGGTEKAAGLWEALLEDYGDTCLRPRIEAYLRQLRGD
jgi:hypothetical protein